MGGIVSAVTNVVKSIFGGGNDSESVSYTTPQITAHDLVASTSSSEPESATLGSDSKKQKNKRGKSSLMVAKDKTTSSSNSIGLNI